VTGTSYKNRKIRWGRELSEEEHAAWIAEANARETRVSGRNGLRMIGRAGPDPEWAALIEALVELGAITRADQTEAARSEWVKNFTCPGCGSSSGFARRDHVGVYSGLRITCSHRCRTRDILDILGLRNNEEWFTVSEVTVIDGSSRERSEGTGTTPLGTVLKRSELDSLPKVEQLVDGLVSKPASVVLVGGYGVGKTFLAMSLGNSVGTGRRWLGRDVQRTRVMYVIGEGAYGLEARMHAWEAAWGQTVSDDDLTFVVQPASLCERHTWAAVTDMARNGGYGFVILDTFSSLAPDADETKDAAMIMRRLGNLATAIEGTAMLVHHPGWSDASRTRGGYQFEANADEVLVATEVSKGSALFTLLRKKVKDGPDGKVLYLKRAESHGSCIIEETRADQAGVPMAERILIILANYGDIGATGPQIMAEAEISDKARSTFYKALRKLQDDEKVRTRGSGNAARYYLDRDAVEQQ
jgi:hypothetical protein